MKNAEADTWRHFLLVSARYSWYFLIDSTTFVAFDEPVIWCSLVNNNLSSKVHTCIKLEHLSLKGIVVLSLLFIF